MKKTSVGPQTRRFYDTPATPMRRLIDGHIVEIDFSRLTAMTDLCISTSPLALKRTVDRRLAAMPIALGGRGSA